MKPGLRDKELSRGPRSPFRRGLGLAALGAAMALYAWLPLSGCSGTSTEMGNPSLTLDFRKDGKPFAFKGFLRIVATGSNPEFYYPRPDDGTTPPDLSVSPDDGSGPSTVTVMGQPSFTLDRKQLEAWIFEHDQLRLLKKPAANGAALHDFNVILQSTESGGDLGGWLASVHADSLGYRTADGDSGKEFVIDLTPGHRCSGEVDGSSPAGKPLALFVPGSPYYALVHGGRFEFVGLPAGRLPLRWVAGDGRVFAVAESLGLAGGGETPLAYSLPGPVHAGGRIDSIAIPDPPPALAPPTASPSGQYNFSDSVMVTLTAAAGATIYYSLDGSTPTQGGNQYDKPLVLRSSATLKAVAYAPGMEHSPVSVNNYVLAPQRPSFKPGAGNFVDSVQVEISGPEGAVIHYTLDGSTPDAASLIYTGGPLVLHESTLVQAISIVPGLAPSAVVSSQYVIVPNTATAPDSTGAPPPHP